MKKNLFIKTNTVKNTLWSPSVKALSSIILTNGTYNSSSKGIPKVKEQQVKLSRKSTKVDSFESSSLSRASVRSSPQIKKNEMKTHKRILSLNNNLSLTNSELDIDMSVKKSKIVSPTKNNKSIFYNAINKNLKTHNRSNSSLNQNTTNSASRFNSTNRRINNFLNKKTTTLILYKNESKVSRNIIDKNNKSISTGVNNTIRTNTKNNKSSNSNTTQHNSSTDDRVNKIKFIQLFWKNNYFTKRIIPKVNLIIKHFRLFKKSKITLNHHNKQNKEIQSPHLKINHCGHGIKTFPRLKTDLGNLRYQIQSYMIHKEQAKIKSILNNREIQITKENNLLFTTENTEGIQCDNIKDYNNKSQLIFNKEHPFIKRKQINSNKIFSPPKILLLISNVETLVI